MKTYIARYFLVVPLCLAPPVLCRASEVDELRNRVTALEQRIAALEKMLQPLIAEAGVKQLRLQARQRMRQDAANYTRDELSEIETLYQVANKKWRTEEARTSLKTLIEKYDKANRTGCAILYLGQMTEGEERIKHLKMAIERFSDCFYGDGVQVGAYARFLLGQVYLETDEPDKAKKLFDEIRADFPAAIDHRGNSLLVMLPE